MAQPANEALDVDALRIVSLLRYQPTEIDGKPVPVRFPITMKLNQ